MRKFCRKCKGSRWFDQVPKESEIVWRCSECGHEWAAGLLYLFAFKKNGKVKT